MIHAICFHHSKHSAKPHCVASRHTSSADSHNSYTASARSTLYTSALYTVVRFLSHRGLPKLEGLTGLFHLCILILPYYLYLRRDNNGQKIHGPLAAWVILFICMLAAASL